MKLELSSEEINKISRLAKERKFRFDLDKHVYSKTEQELIETFINSYRFFDLLCQNLGEEYKDINDKIKIFLTNYNNLYSDALDIYFSKNRDSIFNTMSYNDRLKSFIERNSKEINELIYSAFPVGRVVEIYDPDNAAGLY